MTEAVLLDTSAWLTWSQGEPGVEEVEAAFRAAIAGTSTLHSSFVTLTELEYITTQKLGAEKARELLATVKDKPVHWRHSDDALCEAAAKLKAAHKLSFADAFVAATAQRLDATLVHKDPEFEALAGVIKLSALPFKSGKTS